MGSRKLRTKISHGGVISDGFAAFNEGKKRTENPYQQYSPRQNYNRFMSWNRGWDYAQELKQERMNGKQGV